MPMYLVYREVCYGNGIVYLAIFDNEKDAKNYVNQHKNLELYIKQCVNGEEL